jgi:glycosyltransferase involved in cell wall biosynthesis
MDLCVISSKECWQDATGRWCSYGGFPRQMCAIASLFDRVTMVIVRGHPRAGGMPLPEKAHVVPMPEPLGRAWRRKLFVAGALPYYIAVMAHSMPKNTVVHVPLPGDLPLVGLITAFLLRKRCIARYCGSWVTNDETTVMNKLTRACMRRVAGGRNVMLATGEERLPPAPGMHWTFATVLSREEIDTLEPCVDRGLSRPPHLVYVGRLSPEKGVLTLIRALALLKARCSTSMPMPRVTLAGDGPARAELELAARELGCEHAVTFAGQLPRAELVELLYGADLCVQPSLTEGFSKAWLDAMALGLPVISSNVGAAKSVIGDAAERGWLVKPGDAYELADTIEQAMTADIDWPALRARCRTYVRGRTLDAWNEQIGQLCIQQWGGRLTGGKLQMVAAT